jgi:hypothetical protein
MFLSSIKEGGQEEFMRPSLRMFILYGEATEDVKSSLHCNQPSGV